MINPSLSAITNNIDLDPRPIITVHILSVQAKTLLDSGATHSAVSTQTASRLQQLGIKVTPTQVRISDVQGNALKVHGTITAPININSKRILWPLLIIEKLENDLILGADFMTANNLSINMESNDIIFNEDAPNMWSRKTFNPVYKTFIPDNHHAKIQCQINTANNVTLKPGSLLIIQKAEIADGVFLEESITKVLRRNRIYAVVTNVNPFPVFLKSTQTIGEVLDTSNLLVIPVEEAKIASFCGGATGPIPLISAEKYSYLTENFNCPANTPQHIREKYRNLVLQNHDIFADNKYDLGHSDAVKHTINMKTHQPIYNKQFRIPDTHQEEILNHVKEWQRQNVIEECTSPYNSPVFCVPKKGGGLRIVQDLREINKAAYEDKYAIKDVQECVDAIGRAHSTIFSTMDMASGFWQQELDEGSRDYTAFTIPLLNTQFRWKRTVMGLHGASASFSRLTALVFRGIANLMTYIDDVLAHSHSHEEQLVILQDCFDRMRQFNMKFNIKKCVFGATSITYLGFQLSEEGVAPANDKVEAVLAFTPPSNLKEVRAFIGFCNYFRNMVPNFSRLAGPLIAMTKKESGWKSGPLPPEALHSFHTLKTALCNKPVIGYSRTGGQYILTVDAATTGLGAILSQSFDKEEKIISYWSRSLREHEKNYTPYMLEMTAVCSALEHFHEYLYGRKVVVYTDHRPLLGTSTIQKKTINRLVEKMNIYDIDLRYKKGAENQGADYLSRNPSGGISEISQHDRFRIIKEKQFEDALTRSIMIFLSDKTLPEGKELQKGILTFAPRCYIKNNVLWFVPPKANQTQSVLFTPLSMVCEIISNAHGTPLSGHWGVERTINRISTSYFWPSLTNDVTVFIQHCNKCQRSQRHPHNATLTPWPPTMKPNERVHIDLFGPLRGDPNFKYVAVMTCAFSKWTEVVPIPDKEATTIARVVFEEWICRRGVMLQLISDGGREFANNILTELCKLMDINKHVVTPYHPMANGQVERFNRDMRKYLTTMLDDTSEWALYLKPLQFAHNTALSKSTKFTPHYLTFLDHPRLPETVSQTQTTYSCSYSADAFRRMQYAYKLVYDNNEAARIAYTAHFNKKSKTRQFEIGDEVLVSFPIPINIVNKKLASMWKGPFAVIRVLSTNILDVKASPTSKLIRVHVNRVRLFNHLEDIIVKPTEQNTVNQPIDLPRVSPESEEDNDDDDEGEPIFDNPEIIAVPQPPLQPIPQLAPAGDLLAQELFGRHTRQRGPVAVAPLPNRPLEYKKYTRKK